MKSIGELRGDYCAEVRKQVFRDKYQREPIFRDKPDDFKGKDDFQLACELVDNWSLYNEFHSIVLDQLRFLGIGDYTARSRKL